MTAKNIPGIGESIIVPNVSLQWAHATVGAATTNDVVVDAVGAYTLFNVDESIIVKNIWTQVETAFTATVTLDVGDSGSAARYTSDTTLDAVTTGAVLKADTGLLTVPYVTSDPILVTVGTSTVGVGLLHVYVEYVLNRD